MLFVAAIVRAAAAGGVVSDLQELGLCEWREEVLALRSAVHKERGRVRVVSLALLAGIAAAAVARAFKR